MTNEQAIDILNAVKFIIEDYTDEIEEAFDMAISALKAQKAAGDTISRDAALEACYKGWNKDYKEIAQDIKDLPPAQPEWAQKVEEYRKSAPSFVRNTLVWALYKTWKEYDERLFNHSRAERRTDGRSGQEAGCDGSALSDSLQEG